MRTLVAVACFVFALPALAQERVNAFHVFLGNPSFAHSDRTGDNFTGTIGIAYQRRIGRAWAAELAVARATEHTGYIRYDRDGNVIEERHSTLHSTPVDVAGFYQFPNESSWKPYLGAVVRWIEPDAIGVDDALLYGIDGGVVWQFGKSIGLRFDGKILGGDRPTWVDQLNASAGLSWRF